MKEDQTRDAHVARALSAMANRDRGRTPSHALESRLLEALRKEPLARAPRRRDRTYWLVAFQTATVLALLAWAMRGPAPWLRAPGAAATTDEADQFLALPFADPPSVAQDGMIVRVVATPTLLASLGLQLPLDLNSTGVPMDLLVGPGGIPEAIRFVH